MAPDLLRRLEGDVYFVPGEGKGGFPSCHGFLLMGNETVLIDAGMAEATIREVDREKRIDILLITHPHPDHIRHGYLLQDRHILMPVETADSVADLRLLGERFMGNLDHGILWARFVHDQFGVRALRLPDGRFGDGDVLTIGGAELEAIHAPGHLDDHYCFLERKTGTLITTDIDLTFFGPWCGNPEADLKTFRESIKKVMAVPYRRACSSHKEPIEGDATNVFETYLAGFERQKRMILELCHAPITLDAIAARSPFFKDSLSEKIIQSLFEKRMASNYLTLLVKEGLVTESSGVYRVA
ncbi:MAG: MBL fold metallo-hydrolase [Desulfomonilaceae bacterium]